MPKTVNSKVTADLMDITQKPNSEQNVGRTRWNPHGPLAVATLTVFPVRVMF